MENVSALSGDKRVSKNFIAWIQGITPSQFLGALFCFLFSRASFFSVLRPFSLAFYAAARLSGPAKILTIGLIVLGNSIFSGFQEMLRQLASVLIFEAILYYLEGQPNKKITPFISAIIMGAVVLATGLVKGLIQGLHVYDLITALLMASFVFSLAVLLGPAAEELQIKRNGRLVQDSRMVTAKALFICLAVISLEGLSLLSVELSNIIAGITVLIFARRKGSAYGACAGAFIGFVLALYRVPGSLELPGLFALAGAAAGMPFKSKTVSVCLWTFVTFFFTGISILEGALIMEYYGILASGILFLIIPSKLLNPISDYLAGGNVHRKAAEDGTIRRTSHEAADKLYVLGKALTRVSRNLNEHVTEESLDERTIAESVIEIVAERVCNRCTMCERCWGSHFMKTYKLVEKAVSDLKTDEAGSLEAPGWFKTTCARNEKFFESLSVAYTLYKAEKVWRMQLMEARGQIAEQAGTIAGSIMGIARSIVENNVRDHELEQGFLKEASGLGIPVADIRMSSKNGQGSFFDIVCESKSKFNLDLLDRIVKEKLGTQIVRVGEMRRDLLGYSVMRYIKQPRFRTITGVARLGRENTTVSGDSFTFFLTGNGLHVSAICDGSGSGKRAERYSRTAIQMLEYLIEDGLDIELAIRLMKIYLGIRGENEPLATMDVSTINLLDGTLHFYKQGAPQSYIKSRAGITAVNDTESIEDDGELENAYADLKIDDGDFVIMVSDGVSEAFSEDDEAALTRYLSCLETVNPQQMADQILTEAQTRAHDLHDDMTVLVTRLW